MDISDLNVILSFPFRRGRNEGNSFEMTGDLLTPHLCLCFRFMEDLQVEVQEMEFLRFSKGMDTMRREDFAEWLLHYTNEEDNEVYWENMRKRIPAGQVVENSRFLPVLLRGTLS